VVHSDPDQFNSISYNLFTKKNTVSFIQGFIFGEPDLMLIGTDLLFQLTSVKAVSG